MREYFTIKTWVSFLWGILLFLTPIQSLAQVGEGLILNFFLIHRHDFPEITPNTDPEKIDFTVLPLEPIPNATDDYYYGGFRFKTPPQGGKLIWAFAFKPEDWGKFKYVGLYSIKSGEKKVFNKGTNNFSAALINRNLKGLIHKRDIFVIHELPADSIKPNQEYIIWFSFSRKLSSQFLVSLNLLRDPKLNRFQIFKKYSTNSEPKDYYQSRLEFLAQHVNDMIEIPPNTDPAKIEFRVVTFKPFFFPVDSGFYGGFQFKAPPDSGILIWAFSINNLKEWYISPIDGQGMKGFVAYYIRKSSQDIGGIVKPGDYLIIQDMPPQSLTPDKRYFIWFHFQENKPTKMAISFNIFKDRSLNKLEVFDRYILK